jgi:uncharacterized protein YebE (UPF0316 family)
MQTLLGLLLIFFARVTDVSMATLRTLLVVRGQRKIGAFIGFFEVMIYITALNSVMSGLKNPLNLLFYAAGFATGNFVGGWIEERVAMGYLTAQVIPTTNSEALTAGLRDAGFGVTVIPAMGMDAPRSVLLLVLKRRQQKDLVRIVDAVSPTAVVTFMDTRSPIRAFMDVRAGKSS